MKYVVHVMGMPSSKYGGIERFNVALSQALMEKGLKSVFVYESYPESEAFVEDLQKNHAEVVVSDSRWHPLRFCKDYIQLLKKYRPIIVHAHFTKARFYAIPIARFRGIRNLFFTIHSTMLPKKEIKPFTRLWYSWTNKMSKVIAVSDDICAVYKTNWPNAEVRRIYLGVEQVHGDKNESRGKLGIPQSQMMLLTVSNFNHIKGLDVLCKAIGLLQDRGEMDGTCLYIVGQPESDREALGKLIDTLGIQEQVRMIGISNDVPCFLTAADIYIQSSRNEGIGLALMEAASAGLPLVGTKVGGIPEIVRNDFNGLLAPLEDEEALAKAIGLLMHDEDLRKRYGECSRKVYRDEFSVSVGVEQTLDYYGI